MVSGSSLDDDQECDQPLIGAYAHSEVHAVQEEAASVITQLRFRASRVDDLGEVPVFVGIELRLPPQRMVRNIERAVASNVELGCASILESRVAPTLVSAPQTCSIGATPRTVTPICTPWWATAKRNKPSTAAHTRAASRGCSCPTAPGAIRFGYLCMCNAGTAGATMTAPVRGPAITWPTPTDNWYVIQAIGDTDWDGITSYYRASSLDDNVFMVNHGE